MLFLIVTIQISVKFELIIQMLGTKIFKIFGLITLRRFSINMLDIKKRKEKENWEFHGDRDTI